MQTYPVLNEGHYQALVMLSGVWFFKLRLYASSNIQPNPVLEVYL